MRPRLLVLASTYPRWPGDPEPGFVHELCKRLAADFDVMVVCPHAPGAAVEERWEDVLIRRFRYAPERLESLVNDGGITGNLRRHPWKWLLVPLFGFALAWATWRSVRQFRPGVIHAHWLIPQGAVIAGLAGISDQFPPFLVTSHGADLYALRSRLWRSIKRWVVSRAAGVTVVSAGMRRELDRQIGRSEHLRVEPMGVDLTARFTINDNDSVPRDRATLLFVGRLVEKKGLRCLIEALPLVRHAIPDVRLVVIGFGPEFEDRKAQVLEMGLSDTVTFLGPIPQHALADHYRRASVFVAPFVEASDGDQDGLGLVIVEALGCGCPVVVSQLPATDEWVAYPEWVRRATAGDSVALAEAVIASLKSPRPATPPDLTRFDWGTRAEAYAECLRAISGPAQKLPS